MANLAAAADLQQLSSPFGKQDVITWKLKYEN
jgi:hypothetical protein